MYKCTTHMASTATSRHDPKGQDLASRQHGPEETRFRQWPFLKSWNTRFLWLWSILAWM